MSSFRFIAFFPPGKRGIAAATGVILSLGASVASAEQPPHATLENIVVTAPHTVDPLTVKTDPKAPRQPVPAHDGADYLKNIPGFSLIKKGGTDGDPVFRGFGGSRLLILMNGQQILGGCGGRMDPPTAYIFPSSYDAITLIKGPQTVLYGPGNSAGVVTFDNNLRHHFRHGKTGGM